MKKTAIALLAFAAALFAVSCQKENTPVQNVSGPMTISAVSEGLNTPTKTELAFKYDVLWSASDKIYVKDASGKNDTFSLTGGAGTTKGTFKQDGDATFTGEVQAYFPATMLQSGSPLWPASQTNDQTIPMYCKKTLSGTTDERMDFASLGSVLQIVFNTTQAGVTLKSIEIKDGEKTMSGAFHVDDNGMAIITATDKSGITLDLGTGKALGKDANYFNIAVPAGDYQDLTLVFTATDGAKCIMTKGKVNIACNTVGRLTLTGEKFKADVPAGALPGVFSVSNDDGTTIKQVHFSKGNLWYGKVGDAQTATFNFEANQYDTTPASEGYWSADHISHFYWSKTASVAYAQTYSDSGDGTDVFFTNETETTSKDGFTVNVGGTEQTGWRTLSTAEWQYLFNTRTMTYNKSRYSNAVSGVTIGSATYKGVFLYPDNYNGEVVSSGFMTWDQINAAGIVFLPVAGYRYGSYVSYVSGRYWSSTASGSNYAFSVLFLLSDNPDYYDPRPDFYGPRYYGFRVRLITECQ